MSVAVAAPAPDDGDERSKVQNMKAMQAIFAQNLMGLRRDIMSQVRSESVNLYDACGYPEEIKLADYVSMYSRSGLATRANDMMPDECWKVLPEVYDDEDPSTESPFEAAWKELVDSKQIHHFLKTVDKVAGLGNYAVLLLGFNDKQRLTDPLPGLDEDGEATDVKITNAEAQKPADKRGKRELTFIRCLDQSCAIISEWELDETNARLGQPKTYTLKLVDPKVGLATQVQSDMPVAVGTGVSMDVLDKLCNWTRVIHHARNCTTSEVMGSPELENIFNYLLDHRKILGGSAEMFWKGGFPGLSFEVDPELLKRGVTLNKKELREEMEAYAEGLQRYIALTGVTAKDHSPQVADPSMHLEAIITTICISKGFPKRVFMGSEQGELASSQDKRWWNGRVKMHQEMYLTPRLLRPFVQRLIDVGVLPPPKDGKFKVSWPDLEGPTEDDIAARAVKITQALVAYANCRGAMEICPPSNFYELVLKWDLDTIEQVLKDGEEWQLDNPPEAEQFDQFGNPLDPSVAPPDAPPKPTQGGKKDGGVQPRRVPPKS